MNRLGGAGGAIALPIVVALAALGLVVAAVGLARAADVADLEGTGLTELWCQNVDLFEASYTVVDFYPQSGAAATRAVDWLHWPWASHEFVSRGGSSLALGSHSALTSSDYPVACAARTAWSDNAAAVANAQSEPASELLVPLVVKNGLPFVGFQNQSSLITVQNASAYASCTATVSLFASGASAPVAMVPIELAPGRSRSLSLEDEPGFGGVRNGFTGWARISASAPVAASSLVDVASWGAAYAFEAVPASSAGRKLYVAQFLSGAALDPGTPSAGDGHSSIVILNPGSSASQVSVVYEGAAGSCAGQNVRHGPTTVPPRSLLVFDSHGAQGDPAANPLPYGCRAAATIESTGNVVALVVTWETVTGMAAAYTAQVGGDYSTAIPLWRKRSGPGAPVSTVIAAYNYGGVVADAYLYLLDGDGYGISCGSDCQAMIPPHSSHTWAFSAMSRVPQVIGAAILDSYEPVVAVVSEVSANGARDMASYGAVPGFVADLDSLMPLVLVESEPPAPTPEAPYPEPATDTPPPPTATATVPTVTPTATSTATATATPTTTAKPGPGRPGACDPSDAILDPAIRSRAPMVAIADGLANPSRIEGWCQPRNMSIPYHPLFNPYRVCLTIKNPAVPYHPLFNGLVYKAGCR